MCCVGGVFILALATLIVCCLNRSAAVSLASKRRTPGAVTALVSSAAAAARNAEEDDSDDEAADVAAASTTAALAVVMSNMGEAEGAAQVAELFAARAVPTLASVMAAEARSGRPDGDSAAGDLHDLLSTDAPTDPVAALSVPGAFSSPAVTVDVESSRAPEPVGQLKSPPAAAGRAAAARASQLSPQAAYRDRVPLQQQRRASATASPAGAPQPWSRSSPAASADPPPSPPGVIDAWGAAASGGAASRPEYSGSVILVSPGSVSRGPGAA